MTMRDVTLQHESNYSIKQITHWLKISLKLKSTLLLLNNAWVFLLRVGWAADFALVSFLAYQAEQSQKGSSEGGIAAGINNRADRTVWITHPARNLQTNNIFGN